jgi:hypothetical protein
MLIDQPVLYRYPLTMLMKKMGKYTLLLRITRIFANTNNKYDMDLFYRKSVY